MKARSTLVRYNFISDFFMSLSTTELIRVRKRFAQDDYSHTKQYVFTYQFNNPLHHETFISRYPHEFVLIFHRRFCLHLIYLLHFCYESSLCTSVYKTHIHGCMVKCIFVSSVSTIRNTLFDICSRNHHL